MINRTANSRTRLPGLIETQASTMISQTKPAYENSSVEEIVDSR